MSVRLSEWLLDKAGRANPRTAIDDTHPGTDAWSSGNLVRPLIHGSAYFAELETAVEAARPGDLIYFTDWRGDPDQRLTDTGDSVITDVLSAADRRGVDVRGLIWRSYLDTLSFSAEQNRLMGLELQHNGAEALLDMRVRTLGSHHQKLVVIRYRDHPADDVAFVGGIDLGHSRRDDARHRGDPQPQSMAAAYGPTPAWHDVQVAIHGPAVHDVETVFRERWLDPTPLSRNPVFWLHDKLTGTDLRPDPLPEQAEAPPAVPGGTHHVQLLRTYPDLRQGRDYPYARGGERSVARGYGKALARARELVYIEDQYLWSTDVAAAFVEALTAVPELRVLAVLPRVPDQSKPLSMVPQQFGRLEALRLLREAGGDRVAVYSIENHVGRPVYVHAKVCVMDDVWATVGSDNFNRRSWTHDSELSAVVIDEDETPDGRCNYARRLRLTLAAEHLDRTVGDAGYPGDTTRLVPARPGGDGGAAGVSSDADPTDRLATGRLDDLLAEELADCIAAEDAFATFAESAVRLEAWHHGGQRGPRPPGRLRPLPDIELSRLTRLWAAPMYRRVHDPDGRPRRLRQARKF